MTRGRLALLAAIAVAVLAFFVFDLQRFVAVERFRDWFAERPLQAALIFFAVYVAMAALSLPGAALLTLAAGAIFGLGWGVLIVSFASSFGATLAFLAARYVLRDAVQSRFGEKLRPVNEGIAREGAFYLFALRLIPVFPFFLVNVLMGLTPIRTWTYYWVSQLGMLAGTVVYVYAGTQLAQFRLSAGLVGAFVLLGLFPILAKRFVQAQRARKVYARWNRPARFDYNLVAIGAGSAGLVTAYIGAAVKARVALVERDRMGGDCLNTGCVPSKALLRTARFVAQARKAQDYGVRAASTELDFAFAMERVQEVIRRIEPHDSVARYTSLGVECVRGEAKILTPWTVEVAAADGGKRVLSTRNIVIAAGARPVVPPIPGLREARPLTSENLWELRALPRRLLVLGGGPIGCELAQCFARLGSKVTQVEMQPRLLSREDPEFSAIAAARFRAEGIEVLTGHRAKEVVREGDETIVVVEHEGAERRIACDAILCALGRAANTQGYGLEELGIPLTAQKTVEVNEFLQAHYPNIYACGDVAGPYQFTHTASHMAWYCAVNALFGALRRFRVDCSVIPWVTFTDPEIARVGLNEQEAAEKGIAYDVSTYGIDDLDRAIAEGAAHGLVKVLTAPGKDRILGVTIAGDHAGELLAEFVLAMRHGIGLNKILGTIHAYPTWAEANKYAAGVWKRKQVTRGQMAFAERFHRWTRGEGSFTAMIGALWQLRDKRPYHPAETERTVAP